MSWKVTDQRETVSRDPATGKTIDVVEVTYATDSGVVGSVKIPTTTYNSANGVAQVQEAINSAVAAHESVKALTSES
jgi:hypothetical protein